MPINILVTYKLCVVPCNTFLSLFDYILYICDRLQENRALRGVRKYREKIDRFLKNALFQAD